MDGIAGIRHGLPCTSALCLMFIGCMCCMYSCPYHANPMTLTALVAVRLVTLTGNSRVGGVQHGQRPESSYQNCG